MYSFLNFRDPGIVVIGPGDEPIYHQPGAAQDLGRPQDDPERSSNFKLVCNATKVMKIGPKATQNHEKWTLES